MSWLGVSEILIPSEEDAGLGFGRRVRKALSQSRATRAAARSFRLGGGTAGDVAHRDSLRRRTTLPVRVVVPAVGRSSMRTGRRCWVWRACCSWWGWSGRGFPFHAVLGSTQIFWTTMLSVIVLRERMNLAGIVGITAMFGGITIILLL